MLFNDHFFINTGIDIVYNKRISKNIYNFRFIKRVLSIFEIERYSKIFNYKRRVEFLAGRFAAKEAIIKALSFKINFNSISILNNSVDFVNKDYILVKLSNFFSKDVKDFIVKVSISHESDLTVANSLLIIYF
ncbi:MAG: 4'-phosphopantetheinyl transferase superfamily protein [bacterium]|nr:4'-phosphopantetheinyl transferase superfamily protein [bacterium]